MDKNTKKVSTKQSYHFVAFLDILGYKDYFESDKNDTDKFLDLIESAIDEITKGIKTFATSLKYEFDPIVRLFSDNILIAIKCNKKNEDNVQPFLHLIKLIAIIQTSFILRYGLFLRGGVSKGLFFANDKFVFGKGLVNAYSYEQQAVYPKIMIDSAEIRKILNMSKETFEKIMKDNAGKILSRIIARDSDQQYFVNYLKVSQGDSIEDDFFKKEAIFTQRAQCMLFDPIQNQRIFYDLYNHKVVLVAKINEYGCCTDIINQKKWSMNDIDLRRKVQMKYMWAVEYHNESCILAGKTELLIKYNIVMDNNVHLPQFKIVE